MKNTYEIEKIKLINDEDEIFEVEMYDGSTKTMTRGEIGMCFSNALYEALTGRGYNDELVHDEVYGVCGDSVFNELIWPEITENYEYYFDYLVEYYADDIEAVIKKHIATVEANGANFAITEIGDEFFEIRPNNWDELVAGLEKIEKSYEEYCYEELNNDEILSKHYYQYRGEDEDEGEENTPDWRPRYEPEESSDTRKLRYDDLYSAMISALETMADNMEIGDTENVEIVIYYHDENANYDYSRDWYNDEWDDPNNLIYIKVRKIENE